MEEELAALEGVLPRENAEYGQLGGGCFAKTQHVELFIKSALLFSSICFIVLSITTILTRLDRSVYKQGQVIRPTVECTVEKGGSCCPAVLLC